MTPAELVSLRKRLNMTQVELAARLGIGISTMSLMERGGAPIKPVSALALQALADNAPPPRRYYLLDVIAKTITLKTREEMTAAHAAPWYNDEAVSIELAIVNGFQPWPDLPKPGEPAPAPAVEYLPWNPAWGPDPGDAGKAK